ncbi:MAG: ABC transporter permease [Candidatus Woesearchaeota archaeon]|nr:ABC transporter permease [Candidatus Woesearchaeota archaeon]
MKQFLKMAVESLLHRKLRSWLTMIGIFIGITALISIVSLGEGLEVAITEEFSELGNDKLWLAPGTSAFGASASAANLTDRDRKVADSVPGITETVGMTWKNTKIISQDEEEVALVSGYTLDEGANLWDEMFGHMLFSGRWHKSGDTFKAVVGYDYTQNDGIFERGLKLFDKIDIDGQSFKIIGIMEKQGNDQDDQSIYITDDAYSKVFNVRLEDDYKYIVAKTAAGADPNEIAERLKRAIRNDRDLDEGDEDFTIQTTEEIMDSFGTILQIVQVVIAGIAAISLLVGGVGIMNTMYTSVLERTKEIGIMKAIGAKNSDILLLFLIESGMLGLLGGGIGVITGLGVAKATEFFGKNVLGIELLRAYWSWPLILGALAFAFFVGMISGVFPARQASKQQAVDSLRYE